MVVASARPKLEANIAVVARLPDAELFHLPDESHLAGLGRGEEILSNLMKTWDEQ